MTYIRRNPDDVLLFCGAACIVGGVAMWSIPAALITAGVLLIGFGLLVGKKMANDGTIEKLVE